jgi:aquaporin Z
VVTGGALFRDRNTDLLRKFLLVFTVGASVRSGSTIAPVAIGSVLMMVVYATGHVSGGHVNPAVTMAALVRGRIGPGEAVGYWIAQLVAGVLAALVTPSTG